MTPPRLAANVIDDVAFADRRNGWIAAFNRAQAAVYLYRTGDGGRSWQSLGKPTSHSCGGGPTFLSFTDANHGWMEPVSPNGPGGDILRTIDGGRTWRRVASFDFSKPTLPCLAPIEFVSHSVGWMARCHSMVFSTRDGGRRWMRATIRIPHAPEAPVFDLPRFAGRAGVVAATLAGRTRTAVAFSASSDGGKHWSVRSRRRIGSCGLGPGGPFYEVAFWPASLASTRAWWIVSGRRQALVQVTRDGGRTWHRIELLHG